MWGNLEFRADPVPAYMAAHTQSAETLAHSYDLRAALIYEGRELRISVAKSPASSEKVGAVLVSAYLPVPSHGVTAGPS